MIIAARKWKNKGGTSQRSTLDEIFRPDVAKRVLNFRLPPKGNIRRTYLLHEFRVTR